MEAVAVLPTSNLRNLVRHRSSRLQFGPARRSAQALHSEILGVELCARSTRVCVQGRRVRLVEVKAAKKVSTGRSLVLSSTLIAESGKEKEVARLCDSVLKLAETKKAEKNSGIISFTCQTDAFENKVIHFWERYDTFLAMNNFHASPDYTNFLDEVRPLLSSPVLLAAYEYKDGQIGCMLNPIGPKGEGGLDDATGQGGSGGGASYKQTSQSLQQGISDREGWGMEQALEISKAREAAQGAAAAIANSFRSIFGVNKESK